MIDTHVHYGSEAYIQDLAEVEKQDRLAGVEKTVCLPISYDDNFTMLERTEGFQHMFYAAGVHPLHVPPLPEEDRDSFILKLVQKRNEERLETLKEFRLMMEALDRLIDDNHGKIIAVGETGIDVHTDDGAKNLQMQKISFREHIRLAQRHDLPLILHLRGDGALEEALDVMTRGQFSRIRYRGIWHCFHGSKQDMDVMRRYSEDMVFGIGGIITYPERGEELRRNFRKSEKEEVLSRIVLETDAPYLTPQSVLQQDSGARNVSAYLPEVVRALSEVLETSPEEILRRTTENAERIFGFRQK